MSGGVDSSVAAQLMVENGFECIGATMRLHDSNIDENTEQSCCTSKDIEDAKAVADALKFDYYVYDFQGDFERCVIGNFID